jgi:RecA-family ATPase
LAKVFHGTLDDHWSTLAELSRLGAGIYVTINRTTLQGSRNTRSILAVRAYFVDFDAVDAQLIVHRLNQFGLMPHIVVQTSANRWHVYWCVEKAPLEEFKTTQERLIKLMGSDPNVKDLPHVMRLPGFLNQKDGRDGALVRVTYTNDKSNYSNEDFEQALARFEARLSQPSLVSRARVDLRKAPPDLSVGYREGQRNNECARRAGSCLARGMSEEETLNECLRWNRDHNRPPLDDEEVRATVVSIAKCHARNQGAGASISGLAPSPSGKSLKTVRADQLLANPAPARRWVVEKWIPAAEVTLFGGDGAVGKTTLGLQLGIAAVSSGDWIGQKVNPCNVVYAGAEDNMGEIHFRLEKITDGLQITEADLARLRLIDLAGDAETALAMFDRYGPIKPTPLFHELEALAKTDAAGLIILDAAADFFVGGESERREVRAFIGMLRGLALRLDAAIVLIAHPSVEGIKSGRGYSGSTHWNNAVRSRLYFTAAEEKDDGTPNPDLRVLELAKANRTRRGEKIHLMWMDGHFVVLSAARAESLATETEADEVFLRELGKLNRQDLSVGPSPSINYAPTIIAAQSGSKGVSKKALVRAMHRLLEVGKIRIERYGPPSKQRKQLVVGRGTQPPAE